jgi:O-antigen/teichoic acid export membrane protein
MLVLVRMISPATYGQFALVSSIMTFINVFSFNTFIQHILQVRDESKVNYQIHFTFGFYLQLALFILTNLFSYFLSIFNFYADISLYLHILSFVLFFELFSELYRMQLQRELDWKRMRILHGIGLLVGSFLAIIIAYLGGGIYALILPGFMSNVPFIYEIIVKKKWRPTWYWKTSEYRDSFNFSIKRILSGITTTGKPLLENSFFVSSLSYTELGYYNRAIGLATILVQKFALQFTFSIYPVLTKVEPFTDQFRRISGLIIIFTSWFISLLAFIVFILHDNLVIVLYGNEWLTVISYLGLAAIIMGLAAFKHIVYSLMLSSHQEKICLIFDIVLLFFSFLTLLIFLPLGIIYYLYSQVLLFILLVVFLIMFSVINNIIELNSIYKSIFPPILGIIFSCLLYQLIAFLYKDGLNPIINLVLNSFGILVVYVATFRIFFKNNLITIINYLPVKNLIKSILLIEK